MTAARSVCLQPRRCSPVLVCAPGNPSQGIVVDSKRADQLLRRSQTTHMLLRYLAVLLQLL